MGGGAVKRQGNVPAQPRNSFSFDCGSRTLKPAFRGSGACLRFLSKKRTKGRRPCWHHDAASLLPATERCLFSRPRSLLPPKHEFYFQVQSRAVSRGPGPGPGGRQAGGPGCRWLNGGRPPPSSLVPSPVVVGGLGLMVAPRRAGPREPAGHRAPGRRVAAETAAGGRGLGGVARPSSRTRLRGARRPDGRHFARRPRLGRWRLLRARREEGRRRRSRARGGGEAGAPPPAFQAAARVDAPGPGRPRRRPRAPQRSRTPRRTRGPGGHEEASWLGGAVGASSKGPRGRSGPRGSP